MYKSPPEVYILACPYTVELERNAACVVTSASIAACTIAVLAACVVFVEAEAVGMVGTPVTARVPVTIKSLVVTS